MEAELRFSAYKGIRGIGYGLIGATLCLHATPYFIRVLKMTESLDFDREHPQYEQFIMCLAGIVALIVEPLSYFVFTTDAVNSHGVKGLLWLSPIAIFQGLALSLSAYHKFKKWRGF